MTNPTPDPRSRDLTDDEIFVQQVRAVLTPMPTVNRQAIASILSAVAARKPSRAARVRARIAFAIEQWWYATSPLTRGGAIAAVALTIGFVGRGFLVADAPVSATPSVALALPSSPDSSNRVTLQAVEGASDPASLRVPVQFVLDARDATNATTLSVVGDFNDWDVAATPMTRDGDVWSVSLPLTPGRHVYAFVINGRRWLADPRAPRATDSDFGRPGSVLLVQTP